MRSQHVGRTRVGGAVRVELLSSLGPLLILVAVLRVSAQTTGGYPGGTTGSNTGYPTTGTTGGSSGYPGGVVGGTWPGLPSPAGSGPSGLVAMGAPDHIDLTWNPLDSGGGYRIFRSTTPGGERVSEIPIDTAGGGSGGTVTYTDWHVAHGTTYYYVVTGVNGLGETDFSVEAWAATTAPAVPTGLVATGQSWKVLLSWTPSPGADGYRVVRWTDDGYYGPSEVGSPTDAKFMDMGVCPTCAANNTYHYTVKAWSATYGESGASNTASATPGFGVPDVPRAVRAYGGNGGVSITWVLSPGANYYKIYRNDFLYQDNYIGNEYAPNYFADPGPGSGVNQYSVSAVNDHGESGRSNVALGCAQGPALPGPATLKALGGNSDVELVWNAVPGAATYNLYRSPGWEGGWIPVQLGVGQVDGGMVTYHDGSVSNGTNYTYYVASVNNIGEGGSSNSVAARAGSVPPKATTGITARAGSGQVQLTWNVVTGDGQSPVTYNVYRSTTPGDEWTVPIATGVQILAGGYPYGLTGTYTDSTASNGTTYYYKIAPADATGEGDLSAEVSATPGTAPLPAPRRIKAVASNHKVTLTWAPVTGAEGYDIYAYNQQRLPILATHVGGGTYVDGGVQMGGGSYVDIFARNAENYSYLVAAVCTNGEGDWGDAVTATPGALPLAVPAGLTVYATGTRASLTWFSSSASTSYNLYRSPDPDGLPNLPFANTGSGGWFGLEPPLSYTDGGLSTGQTYSYQVAGVDRDGEGPLCDSASVTTVAAPVNLVATARSGRPHTTDPSYGQPTIGPSHVDLTWDAVPHAQGYLIYRSNQPTGGYPGYPGSTSTGSTTTGTSTTGSYPGSSSTTTGSYPGSSSSTTGSYPGSSSSTTGSYPGTTSSTTGSYPASTSATTGSYPGSSSSTTGSYPGSSSSTTGSYPGGSTTGSTSSYPGGVTSTGGDSTTGTGLPGSGYPGLSLNPGDRVGSSDTPSFTDTLPTLDGTYYYRVMAVTFNSQSDPSDEVSAPVPGSPMNLTATAAGSSINLSWTGLPGQLYGYGVFRRVAGGIELPVGGSTTTTYVDTPPDGVKFYYRVMASTPTGDTEFSNEASATAERTPTGLTATPGKQEIDLAWSADDGYRLFNIYRGASAADPTPTFVGSAHEKDFSDTSAGGGTTYFYFVTAVDDAGQEGTKSDPASAALPAVPQHLKATPGDGQVTLTWDAVPGGHYNVYRGTIAGEEEATAVSSPANPNYADIGLQNGQAYYYVVTAAAGAAESPNSGEASCTPAGAPTGLQADGASESIYLSWDGGDGADSFNIYRGDHTGGEDANPIGNSTDVGYDDTTAADGSTYYYIVKSVVGGVETGASSEVFATALAPPGGVTAAMSNDQVTLSWQAVAGATGYNIYRGTESGNESDAPLQQNVQGTSFTDTTAQSGQAYFYVVTATAPNSESDDSEEASITALTTPTSLQAQSGDGCITLNWLAPYTDSQFNVYRADPDDPTTMDLIDTVPGPTQQSAWQGSVPYGLTIYQDTDVEDGVTYTYEVRAVGADGAESDPSNQASAAPEDIPTHLWAVAGDAQVTLHWELPFQANSCNVYRWRDGDTNPQKIGNGTDNYLDKDVTNGEMYYYVVKAVYGQNESAESSDEVVATPMAGLAGLSAVGGDEVVILSWIPTPSAAGYYVYRSNDGIVDTTATPHATVNQNAESPVGTFTDGGLVNGQTYFYIVVPFTGGSTGNPSNRASATPVGPPGRLDATGGDGWVNIHWTPRDGVTTYNIYRGTVRGAEDNVPVGVSTGDNFTDTTVTNGQVYYYTVTGEANQSESGPSLETAGLALDTPSNLKAVSAGATVSLTWDGSDYTADYLVYRYDGEDSTLTFVADAGAVPSFIDTTAAGANTVYAVQATTDLPPEYEWSGVSQILLASGCNTQTPLSSPVGVVPLGTLSGLEATGGTGNVSLTWTGLDNADSYNVYRRTVGGQATKLSSTSDTEFSDSSVTNGTTYAYSVSAVVGDLETDPCAEVLVTPVAAPANVSASAADGDVTLQWQAVAGATGYEIYRGTEAGGEDFDPWISAVTGTNVDDTEVEDGTTYYYVVTATGLNSESNDSDEVHGTPLSTPATLTATAAGYGEVRLTWSAPASETQIRIYRDGGAVDSASVSPYLDTELGDNGTFSYFVTAVGTDGTESPHSATVSAATPLGPKDLSKMRGDGQVTLTWTMPPGSIRADHFNIYRGTAPGEEDDVPVMTAAHLYDTPDQMTVDTGVQNGTTYYYRLTAVAADGSESADTNEVSATPSGPPQHVDWQMGDEKVWLHWWATPGADHYTVYRMDSPDDPHPVIVQTPDSPDAWDDGVVSGQTYYYYVTAWVGGEETTASVVVPVTPVGAPANLVAGATDTQVQLSWDPVPGATHYEVYRGTVSAQEDPVSIGEPEGTSFTDPNVYLGTEYFYVVTAMAPSDSEDADQESESDDSNEASAMPLAIPTEPAAHAGDGLVIVSWTPSAGAESYNVYRRVAGGAYPGTPVGSSTVPYLVDLVPDNSLTYYYEVAGASGKYESPRSVEVSDHYVSGVMGLTAVAGDGKVTLIWTELPGPTDYKFLRDGMPVDIRNASTGGVGMGTDVDVMNGTTYSYQVVAVDPTNHETEFARSNNASATPEHPEGKLWDTGPTVGNDLKNGQLVPNGRMIQPQDQRGTTPNPAQLVALPGHTLNCEVEAATDLDHWVQGRDSGYEYDPVVYQWTCTTGEFELPNMVVELDGSTHHEYSQTATGKTAIWLATTPGKAVIRCTLLNVSPTPIVPPDTGSRADPGVVRSVEVIVPHQTVQVRRRGSVYGFVGNAVIAAGGQDSPEQKADVMVQLDPPLEGIPVDAPVILGGEGVHDNSGTHDARIVMDQTKTDDKGRVTGLYWGSNVIYNGSNLVELVPRGQETPPKLPGIDVWQTGIGGIQQNGASPDDSLRWDGDPSFDPSGIDGPDPGGTDTSYDTPSSVKYRPTIGVDQKFVPIQKHQVQFVVTWVEVFQATIDGGKMVIYTTDPHFSDNHPEVDSSEEVHQVPRLDAFATFDRGPAYDIGGGVYQTNITVHSLDEDDDVERVHYEAEDLTTWVE